MAAESDYVCMLCGQNCLSELEMKLHIKDEHLLSQSCPICDVSCYTFDELNLHINIGHADLFSPHKSCKEIEQSNSPVKSPSDLMDDIVTYTPDSALIRTIEFATPIKVKVNKETQTYDVIINNPPMCLRNNEDPIFKDIDCPMCSYRTQSHEQVQHHIEDAHFKCEDVVSDSDVKSKFEEYHCNYVNIPHKCCESYSSHDQQDLIDFGDTCLPSDTGTISKSALYNNVNTLNGGASCLDTQPIIYENVATSMDILPSNHQQNEKSSSTYTTDNNTVHIPNRSQLYDCPFCGNTYDSLTSVEVHIDRAHPDALASGRYRDGALLQSQTCPMCGVTCVDVDVMTEHVNSHFDGSTSIMSAAVSTSGEGNEGEVMTQQDGGAASECGNYKTQGERSLSRAMFRGDMSLGQYYQHKALLHRENTFGVDDGSSCTKGVIARLTEYYHNLPQNVSAVHLCSYIDHYASSIGDKGWGCGYRNMQMLLSCLATDELYKDVLFNGCALIPSIPKIQRLIETAWQKGFDKQGAKQLNNRLMNTTKWVGATDIMATLQSLRVKCKLIDFHSPSAPDGTHPKLLQWVAEYFQNSTSTFLPPLFLQHQGHSRTIIGTERLTDGKVRILLLDPATSKSQIEKLKRKVTPDTLKSVRRGVSAFKAKQYQVLGVIGVIDNAEYDQYKVLKSERV